MPDAPLWNHTLWTCCSRVQPEAPMTRSVLPLIAVAAAAALTACADSPVQPTPGLVPTPTLSVSAANRYVVDFNGPASNDLASRVAALGGTVDFIAANAGFAGVSGLSAQAAAALGRAPGVKAVIDECHLMTSMGPGGQEWMTATEAEGFPALATANRT